MEVQTSLPQQKIKYMHYAQSVGRLLIQLLYLILLQVILLIRGALRGPNQEGGGRRADDEGQWRTADGDKFLLLFSITPFCGGLE